MSLPTFVVLPGGWSADADPAAGLRTLGASVMEPGAPTVPAGVDPALADTRTVAVIAQSLTRAELPSPVVFVANSVSARWLPALAVSQRAARRRVVRYVLTDCRPPSPGGDWPDAPVTWVLTSEASNEAREAELGARLRGFQVLTDVDPAEAAWAVVQP